MSTPTCPKCQRPINEGNSPNAFECHQTDDDEGVCEAYALVAKVRAAAQTVARFGDDWAEEINQAFGPLNDWPPAEYVAAKKVIQP